MHYQANKALRACIWLIAATLLAQDNQTTAPAPAPPKPADPRTTPRSAVIGFLEAAIADDYRRASTFLNLTQTRRTGLDGVELARMLKYVLDRKLLADPRLLSNEPGGDEADGMPPDQELIDSITAGGPKVDLILERTKLADGTLVWLISNETVAAVPALYQSLGESTLERYMPSWLKSRGPLDTAWWQWLALLGLIFVAYLIARLIAGALMRAIASLVKHTSTSLDDDLARSLSRPLQIILALLGFRAGLFWVAPSLLLRSYLGPVLAMTAYVALAWLFSRVVDVVSTKALVAMPARHRATASSVMPLMRRTIKVVLFTLAAVASLDAWGFDTTAVLAGLGVGGLAVALAAQKTIENLFGGVALTTDKPVLVGDFCRYSNDKVGTVEDIGLRSTRIRTLERTVVTIPNAQFSSMEIENFGRRDKIWLHPILGLRRDTTTKQIRELIPAIRQILLDHAKVDPNPARVRLVKVGPESLDLEVFAYVLTANMDEFLLVQEELLLQILEAIEHVGTSLAVPQQVTLLSRDRQSAARRPLGPQTPENPAPYA